MKLLIDAKPRRKNKFIKHIKDANYIVSVKEPPEEGRANDAIIKSLSEYFNLPKSQINITQGLTSKKKVIEIPLTEKELNKIEKSKIV